MTNRTYTRPYVGIKQDETREVFRLAFRPTEDLFGTKYKAVIGPFKTTRGAKFMALYGANNPHLQTVSDAERAAVTLPVGVNHGTEQTHQIAKEVTS